MTSVVSKAYHDGVMPRTVLVLPRVLQVGNYSHPLVQRGARDGRCKVRKRFRELTEEKVARTNVPMNGANEFEGVQDYKCYSVSFGAVVMPNTHFERLPSSREKTTPGRRYRGALRSDACIRCGSAASYPIEAEGASSSKKKVHPRRESIPNLTGTPAPCSQHCHGLLESEQRHHVGSS